jgi:hypothetical protein
MCVKKLAAFSEDGLEPLMMQWQLAISKNLPEAATKFGHQVPNVPNGVHFIIRSYFTGKT